MFQTPGELPEDWGRIKSLGYETTLSGLLPLSSLAILYGPIITLVVLLSVGYKWKKSKQPTS